MRKHFVKAALVVAECELRNVERVANPVESSGLSQHRSTAPVNQAADEFVLRIVVLRFGVLAHVEARKPAGALLVFRVVGDGKTHSVEDSQSFTVVHPVGLRAELLVIHPAEAGGHLRGFRLGVLPKHSFDTFHVQPKDFIAPAERVKFRPSGEVFERVVGSVICAPT